MSYYAEEMAVMKIDNWMREHNIPDEFTTTRKEIARIMVVVVRKLAEEGIVAPGDKL